MKLLFAIKRLDSAVGGAERVLCTVCSGLAERGHDVSIVSFDQPGGLPFYPLHDKVRRIRLGIGDSSRKAGFLETLRRIAAMRRLVLNEHPQVAVGFMHSMFVPLAFALAGTSIPLIGSEHIVPEHYRTRPLEYAALLAATPFLAKVTVLSEAIRASYPATLGKRMVVMPNPVMPAVGQADPGADKDRHVLLSVGRLDPQKDHATLLRAFALIAGSFPDWHLRIIGEGPLRPELEHLVQELGMERQICMPGVTSDIGAEYRAADAFVISSRYEAFGLVTAEAMSYGLPVVGFADCPGTNELIQGDRTGLLVDSRPDRVTSLSKALKELLDDPQLRHRLGVESRLSVSGDYSAQRICELWETQLKAACSDNNSQGNAGDRKQAG